MSVRSTFNELGAAAAAGRAVLHPAAHDALAAYQANAWLGQTKPRQRIDAGLGEGARRQRRAALVRYAVLAGWPVAAALIAWNFL